MKQNKQRVDDRGSVIIHSLEHAWQLLRDMYPSLPRAVITLVSLGSRQKQAGYFAHSQWKVPRGSVHEIAINPHLIATPSALLETMLHEAVHAELYEAGKNGGMGSTPYYHTKLFRNQCFAFGLQCEFWNNRYGWTITSWPQEVVPDRYQHILIQLQRDLPEGTGGKSKRKSKGRKLPLSGHTRLVCGCLDDSRSIYVKKSVLESGGVLCEHCKRSFLAPSELP